MRFFNSGLASLAAAATVVSSATAVQLQARDSPLSVTVADAGNAQVNITLTNNGDSDLSLLKYGTFLDDAPVDKVSVRRKNGAGVKFTGILRRTKTDGLSKDQFATVGAGQTITKIVPLASSNDLSASGQYNVVAQGSFAVASDDFSSISGTSIPYASNDLTINVNGILAALVKPALNLLEKRIQLTNCNAPQNQATRNAMTNSIKLSRSAATAALTGPDDKFTEYFKVNDTTTRQTVAARYNAIVTEASSFTVGKTKYYCQDPYTYCDDNTLAYTIPSQNVIVNCPIYYSDVPLVSTSCHGQDETTTSIHEFTHAPGVYSPGTQDYGYGYAAATKLAAAQALLNADTYALFANAIWNNC